MNDAASPQLAANWSRQLRKGVLELLVLLRLTDREYYGYELVQAVTESADGDVAEGTLYPLLNRLAKRELISSRWEQMSSGRRRRYYRITPLGRSALEEMTRRWFKLDRAIRKLTP
ncbi:MAG: PadR family transcriptional regulator [Pseudomonadota bacterium]